MDLRRLREEGGRGRSLIGQRLRSHLTSSVDHAGRRPRRRSCISSRPRTDRESESTPHGLHREHARRRPRHARRDRARLARPALRHDPAGATGSSGRSAIPPALTELELTGRHRRARWRGTQGADRRVCFLGGGSYDHFIPAVVDNLAVPRRVLHGLHALPGRGQPGDAPGDVRVPDADHPADRHGRLQRQPLRRRLGRRPRRC